MSHPDPATGSHPPAAPYGSPAVQAGPQPGAPLPPDAPPAQKARNTLGLIALIAAIVGAVFAMIPGAFAVGWVLLPVGFILAIVALCRRGRKKGAGVAALIVSVVGTIIGVVVFVSSLSSAVVSAIEEGGPSETTVEQPVTDSADEEEGPAEEAPAEEGTRTNPYPAGSTVVNDDWAVTVDDVAFAATDTVLSENPYNEAPGDGSEYILVQLTVAYTGADEGIPAEVQIEYVTPDGVSIASYDTMAVIPDALDIGTTLYTDARITGNVSFVVPSESAGDGVLAITPGFLGDKVFVALR